MKLIAIVALFISFKTSAVSTFFSCSGSVIFKGNPENVTENLEVNVDEEFIILGTYKYPLKYKSDSKYASNKEAGNPTAYIEFNRYTGKVEAYRDYDTKKYPFPNFFMLYDLKCRKLQKII
jgi:hypothetical protein